MHKSGLTNKNIQFLISFLFAIVLAAAIGCGRSGSVDSSIDNPADDSAQNITITGYVSGAGVPLTGAVVTIGAKSVTTEDGNFSIETSSDEVIDSGGIGVVPVKITAEGYSTGYAKVVYLEDKTSYNTEIKLLLITAIITNSHDISSGVNIMQSGKNVGNLQIPSDSFPEGVTQITGTVTYIDPSTPDIDGAPGGDFQAIRSDNSDKTVSLDSQGMMEFNLVDQDGNPVTDLRGDGATILMKVPAGDPAVAGDMTPLWWYNPEIALWQEDGTGTVVDGSTIGRSGLWVTGKVSHFTWWNYDRPVSQHACFKFSIVDEASNEPIEFNWRVAGETYRGTSPERLCDLGNEKSSTFTVKKSTTTTEQVKVYTYIKNVRYYLVDDNDGTYSLSTDAINAKIFDTPSVQGSGKTGTLIGTATPLDGDDGILPLSIVNKAPQILSLSAAKNILAHGDMTFITVSVDDAEGDDVDITWSAISGAFDVAHSTVSTPDDINVAFTAPESGDIFVVTVTATDTLGNTSSASINIIADLAMAHGSVQGRLYGYYDFEEGTSEPAVGYPIILEEELFYGNNEEQFQCKQYFMIAHTDSNGYYLFENVPLRRIFSSGEDVIEFEFHFIVRPDDYEGFSEDVFSDGIMSIIVDDFYLGPIPT